MKCPKCGHEVNQGEAFCGQCGASMMSSSPLATEMVQTPPRPGGTALFPPGTQLPQHNQPINRTASFENASRIDQELPPTHHQQTGFYQDATEALSAMQGVPRPTYPPPQGSYPGVSPYNTQMQPLQTSGYIPQQTYGYPSGRMAVPPQQKSSPMILIVCICLVIALVATGGIAALYYMNGQTAQNPGTSTATVVPTPTPTPSPTPTPTPSPTPTVAATPAPDPGFLWCGPVCVTYGFMTQYPMNWQPGAPTNSPGIQFTNLEQPDQFAAFKAPGPANQPAEALVAGDLQANFATQPGYTPPPANTTATIGGVTWIAATAYYNPTVGAPAPTPTPTPVVTPDPAATATPVATPADPGIPPGQGDPAAKVRVVVYATVYQNKAYIIELQALDAQFDTVYAQAFNTMLTKFQFLPANPTP